ncbi:signal peptidase II [Lapidilactobacillus bayanensis]|uniref:signal peptidase II n=1 Tax=Lapidilactobacillus bayanensis TaxID=2485998 RepID=UPI00384D3AD6
MYTLILIIGAAVVGADQLLKTWITNHIAFGHAETIVPGLLSMTKIHNTGAAWSSFEGKTWFFYIVTLIAVAIILPLLIKAWLQKTSLVYYTGLVLMLAGTIGNFIDRARQGFVVDMFQLDFINFPIFNIADLALTVGVVLLFIFVIFLDRDEEDTNA